MSDGGEPPVASGQHVRAVKVERAIQLRRQMTPQESLLWHWLRTNRLHGLHFRRQQIIDGFIVDFYCHAARLVVEVDGSVHATREAYDAARDAHLRARGLQVLRVTNDDVAHHLPGMLARIATACGLSTLDPRE